MTDFSNDDLLEFLGSSNGSTTEPIDEASFESVEYEELPPLEPDFLDNTKVGDGVCESCGGPTFRPPGLTASGSKKRVPKRCDNCRKNVSVPPIGPSPKGVEPQLRRIQEELADDIKLLGILAGPIMPVTGMYMTLQADAFTLAIIKLCKNNQRMLRVLHRAASVAPIYTVAETLAGTAIATQVDLKGMDPNNMFARRLGVSLAYDMVNNQQQEQQPAPQFQAAPRY